MLRILLDECVPKKLKLELPGYDVKTVPEMRWAGFKNGALLAQAEKHFDVLITIDRKNRKMNLQHDVGDLDLAIVVLMAATDIEVLRPLMPQVREELQQIGPGRVVRVGA